MSKIEKIYQRILAAKHNNLPYEDDLSALIILSQQTTDGSSTQAQQIGLANYYMSLLSTKKEAETSYFNRALELRNREALLEKLRNGTKSIDHTEAKLNELFAICKELIGNSKQLDNICTISYSLPSNLFSSKSRDPIAKEAIDLVMRCGPKGLLLWAHYTRHNIKLTYGESDSYRYGEAESLINIYKRLTKSEDPQIKAEALYGLAKVVSQNNLNPWLIDSNHNMHFAVRQYEAAAALGLEAAEDALLKLAKRWTLFKDDVDESSAARRALVRLYTPRCNTDPRDSNLMLLWSVAGNWKQHAEDVQKFIIEKLRQRYKDNPEYAEQNKTVLTNWISTLGNPQQAVFAFQKLFFARHYAVLGTDAVKDHSPKSTNSADNKINEIIKHSHSEILEALNAIMKLAQSGYAPAIEYFKTKGAMQDSEIEKLGTEQKMVIVTIKSMGLELPKAKEPSNKTKQPENGVLADYQKTEANKLSITDSDFYKVHVMQKQDPQANYLVAQWYKTASSAPLMESGLTLEEAKAELLKQQTQHLEAAVIGKHIPAIEEIFATNETRLEVLCKDNKNDLFESLYLLSLKQNGLAAYGMLIEYSDDPIAIFYLSKMYKELGWNQDYQKLGQQVIASTVPLRFDDKDVKFLKDAHRTCNLMANLLLAAFYDSINNKSLADVYRLTATKQPADDAADDDEQPSPQPLSSTGVIQTTLGVNAPHPPAEDPSASVDNQGFSAAPPYYDAANASTNDAPIVEQVEPMTLTG